MATAPPASGGVHTLIQRLGDLIRYWVHYDTSLQTLNKQVKATRDARNAYEAQILQGLRTANMGANPVIQIAGGRILVSEERYQQPLSARALEGFLHQYYRQKPGARDETADILKFIKAQRKVEMTPCLRRQMTPTAVAAILDEQKK
jgi:hypothetical protein